MQKTKVRELTDEQLAILNDAFPAPEESNRLQLPRFGMLSKDITEESGSGKNKKIKVVEAAGTFYTEKDLGEVDKDGKKVWTREYLSEAEVDLIIVYHRRQLRMFDSSLEKFYSTPIYDNSEQVLPLYLDKQVVKRGTQAELQAMFPALTLKGKPSSKLKEDCILYVVYKNELYQCNLSQSSKWEFKSYAKTVNPSTVVTSFSSVEDSNGTNTYHKMVFKKSRAISQDEFETVNENQQNVKAEVEQSSQFLLGQGESKKVDDDFDKM